MKAKIDKREEYAADEAKQRQIKLRLLDRERKESQPMWLDKQRAFYGNVLQISQPPSLAKLITDEQSKSIYDTINNETKLLDKLIRIASPENAEYILDRLEPDEIFY